MITPTDLKIFDELGSDFSSSYSYQVNEGGLLVNVNGSLNIQFECFFSDEDDSNYLLNNYSAWIINNKNGGQEQISSLKNDGVFGYIFPINSLVDESALIDCKFKLAYARAAVENIFFKGIAKYFITTLNMEVVLLVFIKQQETEDLPFDRGNFLVSG